MKSRTLNRLSPPGAPRLFSNAQPLKVSHAREQDCSEGQASYYLWSHRLSGAQLGCKPSPPLPQLTRSHLPGLSPGAQVLTSPPCPGCISRRVYLAVLVSSLLGDQAWLWPRVLFWTRLLSEAARPSVSAPWRPGQVADSGLGWATLTIKPGWGGAGSTILSMLLV